MSATIPSPLPSPGFGARRKGPKTLPRLPLSAFTPPNSGTSEKFPLPPSPSSVQPQQVIDALVVAPGGDLSRWVQEAGPALNSKASGVVVSLVGTAPADLAKTVETICSSLSSPPIVAVLVPYSLEDGIPTDSPAYLTSDSKSGPRIILSAVYTRYSTQAVDALRWALDQGFTIDLDIKTNLRAGEGAWEDLEELLTKAIQETPKGSIILSNILPPPDDLSSPLVILLTHPTYRNYQSQTAALSLYPNVVIKYLPPTWGHPSSATPSDTPAAGTIDKEEWKQRIKMYIGPALEAFGYQRILFGSSPSSSSPSALPVSERYELARECFAELGIEQEDIQAIFCDNAKRVYGS